jgi:hypothetical protein
MLLMVLGMIFVVSFKGAQPISYIALNERLCISIAGAMAVFGTLEQLLFCRKVTKPAGAKPASKSKH